MAHAEATEFTERESMECDVIIVGAGVAGLAAAIQLKKLAPHLLVVVLEKAPEVGAHTLSGAVIDPGWLDALLPDWRAQADCPLVTEVADDRFLLLGKRAMIKLPNALMPPFMSNHGNFIGSLGQVCAWLAVRAEQEGIDIYPGFAATELLYDDSGAVCGVATGDTGIDREGVPGPAHTRGMALYAKYVLLAEGARGSLSKQAISHFGLDSGRSPQKFGIGLKEVWRVAPERHRPGLVQHSLGWPLRAGTGGGSFLYHYGDNLVSVGFVVHLDYANPYLSPFEEFQRLKTHPAFRETFAGGKRLGYGARAITEGGWQSVPRLIFPGGALIGCAAGFVNLPRIKGSHNAALTGMQAAEAIAAAIGAGRSRDELTDYEDGWRDSPVGRDLHRVRNVKPLWSRFGSYAGIGLGALDMWIGTLFSGLSPFGTLGHAKADSDATEPAIRHAPIQYPKPDGVLTFDRLSSVYLSNTNHEENQPLHLLVRDPDLQRASELGVYAGPSARYCPAGVYEWIDTEGEPRFQINAQNCVHCKTCDIKDPNGNITWVPPQGGEGPIYSQM